MTAARSRKTSAANPEAGWFGFSRVDPGDKTAQVRRVFDKVASRYDLMNDLMSGGLHRLWKNRLVDMMRPRPGQAILDVAGGTGDIALRCAARAEGKARIFVCDINPAMLEIGRDKAIDKGWLDHPPLAGGSKSRSDFGGGSKKPDSPACIKWITGDAEALPFASRSMDTVCIAFGLRNVTRIDTALAEFARVLKPGGRFFCLEFSPGVAPWLKELYGIYSFSVLPWLGEHVAEDRKAYQYLAESIRQFPDQPSLAKRMKKAGFSEVQWRDMACGIAVIHSGWRI